MITREITNITFDDTMNEIAKTLLKFIYKTVCIEINLWVEVRTNQQNKYLWKVFDIISKETGYTLEQTKYLILSAVGHIEQFANKKTGEINTILKPTKTLSTKDFGELTERILQFCAEHNLQILTPQEYFET
jgi:hypothetical protein